MSLVRSFLTRAAAFLDLPDPNPIYADRGSNKLRFNGPLILNGISYRDVTQGYIANCFVPAAIGSMAALMPEDLEKAMKKNNDGTVTFTFRKKEDGMWKKVPVTVDTQLYVNDKNALRYGATMGKTSTSRMETWFPLLEKAYAQFVGDYNVLNQGGYSQDVLSALTGRKGRSITINPARPDKLWNEVTSAVDEGRAAALGTYSDGRHMKGSGIIDDHAYSLLGYEEDENGEKWVELRNPWGKSEPKGNGKDDGVFKVKLAVAAKYFETFDTIA